ncbi:MAG: lysophospholipid acyltransferase family protein [Tannerella sp.]|jgi:1-acyl-sn-glycerol-3-phosphate acyltransferase|nr:lysophospholipid acyltransferase family protein [Tannerella sp.]
MKSEVIEAKHHTQEAKQETQSEVKEVKQEAQEVKRHTQEAQEVKQESQSEVKEAHEVNPEVIAIADIQNRMPLLRSRLGVWLVKRLFRLLAIDKVNEIHARHCHLRGAAFTSSMLADPMMNVSYRLHNSEALNALPEGAFITVSNHPVGSLDGIILIDIFASRRPDFRVMVNGVLSQINAMGDNFISVTPKTSDNKSPNPNNINGVRLAIAHIREGHPIGFFPAGAMSFYDVRNKTVRDLPWTHSVIRIIRKAGLPVIPVYFDCLNSKFFYRLGRINWKLRVLRVAIEAFNKRGRTLDVHIRQAIPHDTVRQFTDDVSLAEFLYKSTYGK